jgi:hypothetical protein
LLEKKIISRGEIFRLVESLSAVTIVTSEDFIDDVKKNFSGSILKENKGLVEVTLKTSKDIETIPGVMAQLYSMIAEAGINIVETMSCWTDTIFIFEEKDLAKVMDVLRF